jgi:hypothetical protein
MLRSVRLVRCERLIAALLACSSGVHAESANDRAEQTGGSKDARGMPSTGEASLGFSLFGGVTVPGCSGQLGACDESVGPAPSVRALVLYQPDQRWGIGLMGQVARVHWSASYVGMVDGRLHPVDSDLTTGFAGLAGRLTVLPEVLVSPVLELALGSAFQSRPEDQVNCLQGFTPTAQVGVGARVRVAPVSSIFVMGSASYALHAGMCGVSDGPPAVPFVDWGIGLHAGASFDVVLTGQPSTQTARR